MSETTSEELREEIARLIQTYRGDEPDQIARALEPIITRMIMLGEARALREAATHLSGSASAAGLPQSAYSGIVWAMARLKSRAAQLQHEGGLY